MAIITDSTITWENITTALLNALKAVCCNIDSFASNVPANLKSGTASNPSVWTKTTSQSSTNYGHNYGNQWASQTFTFYANNTTNLISVVTSSTVSSEWSTFLSSAGANARSNKVIQAKDYGLAMGLVSQFMAGHLKRVYSTRQILGGSLFQGTKYVTGTITPKYQISGLSPSSSETISNSDITSLVRQNIVHDGVNYGILDREGDPRLHRIYLN